MLKKLFLSLIIGTCFIAWMFQNSLANTWRQSNNSPYPLASLKEYKAWSVGGEINDQLITWRDSFFNLFADTLEDANVLYAKKVLDQPYQKASASLEKSEEELSPTLPSESEETSFTLLPISFDDSKLTVALESNQKEALKLKKLAQASKATLPENEFALTHTDGIAGPLDYAQYSFKPYLKPIVLHEGDQVLIVGDSMQQGVGRHVKSYLSKAYGIYSKNLAKQSTGLISPFNTDWNKVVRQEMASNKRYKAVIMMLGANDSYGITDPNTRKVFPWGSKLWNAHYLQRIMAIMYEARSHGAAMIWIQPPNVNNKTLNMRIQEMNKLYASAGEQYGAIVVSANEVLGMKDATFLPSITIDGKIHKTRSGDGIHFTPFGEKLVAKEVYDNFLYLPDEGPQYTFEQAPAELVAQRQAARQAAEEKKRKEAEALKEKEKNPKNGTDANGNKNTNKNNANKNNTNPSKDKNKDKNKSKNNSNKSNNKKGKENSRN